MNDRAARIAASFGLLPILICVLGVIPPFFGERLSWAVIHGLALLSLLHLWRRYIRWTRRRIIIIKLMLLPLIANIAIGAPLYHAECLDGAIYTSQTLGFYGFFRLFAPFVLWGMANKYLRVDLDANKKGVKQMTPTAVRLVAGFALIPLIPGVFYFQAFYFDEILRWSEPTAAILAAFTTGGLTVGVWVGLWRKCVNWTTEAVWGTLILALILMGSGFSYYVTEIFTFSGYFELMIHFGPLWAIGFWFLGTSYLWRERASAEDDSIARSPSCPECSYSLRGLSESRCPECGWAGLLDDVFRPVNEV